MGPEKPRDGAETAQYARMPGEGQFIPRVHPYYRGSRRSPSHPSLATICYWGQARMGAEGEGSRGTEVEGCSPPDLLRGLMHVHECAHGQTCLSQHRGQDEIVHIGPTLQVDLYPMVCSGA